MIRDTLQNTTKSDGSKILSKAYRKNLKGSIRSTVKTIGFADVDVDGRFFTVAGTSGDNAFAPFVSLLNPRQLKTTLVNGRDRFSDAEVKILEQVLHSTTSNSVGHIRLVVNRYSCTSCAGTGIPAFQLIRPGIKIEISQLATNGSL